VRASVLGVDRSYSIGAKYPLVHVDGLVMNILRLLDVLAVADDPVLQIRMKVSLLAHVSVLPVLSLRLPTSILQALPTNPADKSIGRFLPHGDSADSGVDPILPT